MTCSASAAVAVSTDGVLQDAAAGWETLGTHHGRVRPRDSTDWLPETSNEAAFLYWDPERNHGQDQCLVNPSPTARLALPNRRQWLAATTARGGTAARDGKSSLASDRPAPPRQKAERLRRRGPGRPLPEAENQPGEPGNERRRVRDEERPSAELPSAGRDG